MKSFLALMAAAMLAISVGCAPEAGTAANDTAKPTEGPTATNEADAPAGDAAATGEFQSVSLKVPGMT